MHTDRLKVFTVLFAWFFVLVSASFVHAATFTIGGTVSGLSTGASVTLLNNRANSLKVTVNGKFTFTTALATGAAYSVTVGTEPTGETCTVTGGSGTVGTSNVTTVAVACTPIDYTIGGTLTGLDSGTSVTLVDGDDSVEVGANGSFTFPVKFPSGATYNVTVGTQPSGETCTVTNGSGTIGTKNVTTVKVACAAPKEYTLGGTVSGLNSGTSVTLVDGDDSIEVGANGSFTFPVKFPSGTTYNVTVGTQPSGETCTVTNGSGTISANVSNIAVSCSGNTGGGGAFWIPFSATPVPGASPAGQTGLFLIPSDKLTSAPSPSFITTDKTQLLGIGTQITGSGSTLTYSPQVMMYADTNSSGVTKIFGLNLVGTGTVPAPAQISNLSLASGTQICQIAATSETNITTATTLFAVIEVGTSTQCSGGTGTFEVVHYTDSATTAPVVVSLNTTTINSIYQDGKLTALLVFDSATSSLDVYADDTFTSPTQLITSLSSANYVAGVLDEATLSTSGAFFQVATTSSVNELYRIDGSTLAATLIQNLSTATLGSTVQDDNNLYYIVFTPGSGGTTTATIEQVALTGGTPKKLYTSPSFTQFGATSLASYLLVGSDDSVVAFEFYSDTFTSGIEDPTKATATLYSVPVGTTTTTPTTLETFGTGSELPEVFVAAPSGSGIASNVLFATVQKATGSASTPTIAFSAISIPLNGGTLPAPIANSVYAPLPVITSGLTDSVWQVTGITDTNGGYGGGTANQVNVSTLADTPFTTTGGGNYVFPTGFGGALFGISSNAIALGFFENGNAVIRGTATLQEYGAATDLSKSFFYPVSITNTYVQPY
jgi:hypothetical protein